MMKKALLVVAVVISLLSVFLVLNDIYLFLPQVRLGLFKLHYIESDFVELLPYDLSEDSEMINLLCYLEENKEFVLIAQCFKKETGNFEEIEVSFESNFLTSNLNFSELRGTLQLFSIDLNKKFISLEERNYRGDLIKILEGLNVEDFVLVGDVDSDVKYFDLYDFVKVRTELAKIYTGSGGNEQELILKELNTSLIDALKKNYIFFYPASSPDITYIQNYNPQLATLLRNQSESAMDYLYQDFLYVLSNSSPVEHFYIDGFILENSIKLYKVQDYIKLNHDVENSYLQTINEYMFFLNKNIQNPSDQLNVMVKYIPVTEIWLQDYLYDLYLEDTKGFISDVSMLSYYIFSYIEPCELNKYTITNIIEY